MLHRPLVINMLVYLYNVGRRGLVCGVGFILCRWGLAVGFAGRHTAFGETGSLPVRRFTSIVKRRTGRLVFSMVRTVGNRVRGVKPGMPAGVWPGVPLRNAGIRHVGGRAAAPRVSGVKRNVVGLGHPPHVEYGVAHTAEGRIDAYAGNLGYLLKT